MTQKNEQQIKQLDQDSFNQIAGAFSRLQQLGDKKLATGADDNTQAEREQLIEYLATELLSHCSEFLAAWVLANGEYLPLLRSLKAVAQRAGYFPARQPMQVVNPTNN